MIAGGTSEEVTAPVPVDGDGDDDVDEKFGLARKLMKDSFKLNPDRRKETDRRLKNDDDWDHDEREHEHLVAFESKVEVHQHNLVLGDHPDAKSGPPVQLGWEYKSRTSVLHDRPEHGIRVIPKKNREIRLRENGYTNEEIERAADDARDVSASRVRESGRSGSGAVRIASRSGVRVTAKVKSSSSLSSSSSFSGRRSAKQHYSVTVKSKNGDAASGGGDSPRPPPSSSSSPRGVHSTTVTKGGSSQCCVVS